MKKVLSFFLFASITILLVGPLSAQTQTGKFPKIDGKLWNSSKPSEKLMYVLGFTNGAELSKTRYDSLVERVIRSGLANEDTNEVLSMLPRSVKFLTTTQGMSYGDVVAAIDKFFSQRNNISLPIWAAYDAVIMKSNGLTEIFTGKKLQKARK